MVRTLFIVFCCFLITGAFAQTLEFDQVEKLPDAVNSESEESMPLLAPGGGTLYFARFGSKQNTGGKFTGSDIWASDREGNTWKKATNKRVKFNNTGTTVVVGLSDDGKTLYFMDSSPNKKIKGIYFSRKTKAGTWDNPELVPIPGIESENFIGFYVTPAFDAIFISMAGTDTMGEEDLYISTKDNNGKWSRPKNLGSTINTVGFEIAPFFSASQKRLYFSSNGHGGEGDADIFYCDRLYDSWETWSAPKNLGDKINTKSFDGFFSISDDSLAFFTSNRGGELADIYQAKAKKVMRLNDKNYLTERQVETVLGANINRKFSFAPGTTEMSQAQRELLWYIANKVLSMSEIHIDLIAQKADAKYSQDVYEKRLNAMVDYLKLAGIDRARIRTSVITPDKTTTASKGELVELFLFE
jgi:hypothetical protein